MWQGVLGTSSDLVGPLPPVETVPDGGLPPPPPGAGVPVPPPPPPWRPKAEAEGAMTPSSPTVSTAAAVAAAVARRRLAIRRTVLSRLRRHRRTSCRSGR